MKPHIVMAEGYIAAYAGRGGAHLCTCVLPIDWAGDKWQSARELCERVRRDIHPWWWSQLLPSCSPYWVG